MGIFFELRVPVKHSSCEFWAFAGPILRARIAALLAAFGHTWMNAK
jgi:hypothetical protein